jgi:hypothetical protein
MALILAGTTEDCFSAQAELVKPEHLIVDKKPAADAIAANEYVARVCNVLEYGKSPWPVMPWRLILLIKRLLKVRKQDLKAHFSLPGVSCSRT